MSTIRDALRCQPNKLFLLPFAIIVLLLFPVITLTFVSFATVVDLLRGLPPFPPDCTSVPTFYVPNHRYSKWYHSLLLVTLGVVFGGIHCSGWIFSFPTHAEQKLWRVASLAVTVIPIAQLPFIIIIFSTGRSLRFLPRIVTPYVNGFSSLFLFLCALAYVSARLVLLGLALALLRHLPPAAFTTISWTKFFPHFH